MGAGFSKPDFMVVGPFRTGTTWLYSQLCRTPGFSMPPYKELSFFYYADRRNYLKDMTRRLANGTWKEDMPPVQLTPKMKEQIWADYRLNLNKNISLATENTGPLWANYYKWMPRQLNWFSLFLYTRLFNQSQLTGDISPAYFALSADAIGIIKKFFPQLKVIFILRDPVEREWSAIRMNYFDMEGKSSFSEEKYFQHQQPGSDYISAITNWEKYFDKDHILYLFFDDLVKQPEKFISNFLQFIKPGAGAVAVEKEKEKPGAAIEIDPALRRRLFENNLAQYDFLASKFGPESYPAQWRKKAFAMFEAAHQQN